MRKPLALLVSLLVGCSWSGPGAPHVPLDLTVSVKPSTRTASQTSLQISLSSALHLQTVPGTWTRADLTLSNANGLMTAPVSKSLNQAGGSTVTAAFTNLRPGSGYSLTVKLFNGSTLAAQGKNTSFSLASGTNTVNVTLALPQLTVTTAAGNGTKGDSGDGGAATAAQFKLLNSLTVDGQGNLYIVDTESFRIRKVDAVTQQITTVVGTGAVGFSPDGTDAASARIGDVYGVAVDAAGNVYYGDWSYYRVRKVDAVTKKIVTVAGNGTQGSSGDGNLATEAQVYNPYGVALDPAGNLYVMEAGSKGLRRVDAVTKRISTMAWGFGFEAYNIAADADGNVYVADYNSHQVKKVHSDSTLAVPHVTTVAGTGGTGYTGDTGQATAAQVGYPWGVAVDGDTLYIVQEGSHNVVRKVDLTTGEINTFAGGGTPSDGLGDGLAPRSAAFQGAFDAAVGPNGEVFITDTYHYRVRKVSY